MTGGLLSVALLIVILLFASVKFDHLMTKFNPQMSQYFLDLEKDEKLDLKETGFRIAFAIEDYYAP